MEILNDVSNLIEDPSQVYHDGTLYGKGTKKSPLKVSATALLPDQTGHSGEFLTTDGTTPSWSAVTGYTDEEAQDAVGSILVDGQTINFTYADGTPSITAETITQMSVTADASGLKLSGDASSPGNIQYYGTNAAGTKGWYNLAPQINEYTTAQSATILAVPSGAKTVNIVCIGAGGGGGAGRRGAAGSIRSGGSGGGAGWGTIEHYSIAQLGNPTNLYVTVGTGGPGGIAQTADDSNGANGTAGTASFVSTSASASDAFIQALGGNAGAGGDTDGATGGGQPGGGGMFAAGSGGNSSATGAAGSGSTINQFITGGGGGGGITSGDVASAGGASGASCYQLYSSISGGAINSNGTTPTLVSTRTFGQGGSGGGSSITTVGGTGGNGVRGGGGAGGGASLNGNNSGAGGAGGDGYVRVTFNFNL